MNGALSVALVGFAFGASCGLLKVPIPAPPTMAGACGVIAVTGGYLLAGWLR